MSQFITEKESILRGSDVLTILADIFLAFAGFTGIVAVLGQRSEGKWRPIDLLRFQVLLEASLVGLVLSVAPFSFYYFGVAEAVTWGSGSALLAIYISSALLRATRKQQKLGATHDPDFVPGVRLFLFILAVPVVATLILNLIGIGFQQAFPGFLVGLIYVLIMCCAMFVLLLRFVRTGT